MKCELIRPMPGANPEYDHREHLAAKAAGKPYTVPSTIELPAGHVIDHPDCWVLVMEGVAKPLDAECRARAPIDDAEIARRGRVYKLKEEGRLVGYATGDTSHDRPKRAPKRKPAPPAPPAAS